jgi:hypothetical protein
MPIVKRVRVIKKIQESGAWRFISLKRAGKRYVWDPRPGAYYLEWWDGGQRLREVESGACQGDRDNESNNKALKQPPPPFRMCHSRRAPPACGVTWHAARHPGKPSLPEDRPCVDALRNRSARRAEE